MGRSKWHMHNHFVADLKQMGGICYIENGLYEIPHNLLNKAVLGHHSGSVLL